MKCGRLSPFGALPCAEPPNHEGKCRDVDRVKAWPGPNQPRSHPDDDYLAHRRRAMQGGR